MRPKLFGIVLILGIAWSVFSQADPANPAVITSVSISGIKRTKLHVAEKALHHFIGKDAASLNPDDVKARILDTEIFEPVSVEVLDDPAGEGKILAVEVREKLSVFPVPVFFMDKTGIVAGGAFYDGNAFGMNHRMAFAGLYQTGGMVFTTLYIAPPADVGSIGWNSIFLFTQEERQDSDQKKATLRRFNSTSVTFEAGLQYQFMESLTAGINVTYLGRMLRKTENPLNTPLSGAHALSLGTEISVRKSSWDGYLLSEESATLGYHFFIGLDSPSFHSVQFRGIYEKSLFPGFRTNFRSGALFSPYTPLLFESGPDISQVNILPRSFSARHYAGLSLGLEKFLFRFPFGTISLLTSWQMVYSRGPLLENRDMFDYGLLGSVFFYMSKVAIPAIGLGVAYNIPADFFQFSFMIGMSL